jgi:hypothetical protein
MKRKQHQETFWPIKQQIEINKSLLKNIPLIKPLKYIISNYHGHEWFEKYPIIKRPIDWRDKFPLQPNQVYARFSELREIQNREIMIYDRVFDIFEGIQFISYVPEKVNIKIGENDSFNIPIKNNKLNFWLPIVNLYFSDIHLTFIGDLCPKTFECDFIVGILDDDEREFLALNPTFQSIKIQNKIIKWKIEDGKLIFN